MSFDVMLYRRNKARISRRRLESVLWSLPWIHRTTMDGQYEYMHQSDDVYIEIKHLPWQFEDEEPGRESAEYEVLHLQTWACSSRYAVDHLADLTHALSEQLNLVVYDPQSGLVLDARNLARLEDSYSDWRQFADHVALWIDGQDSDNRLPVKVFVAHSFAPEDSMVNSIVLQRLKNTVAEVLTGRPYEARSVSEKVKSKIRSADLVVAILTRRVPSEDGTWSASEWVVSEAVFAHGADKPLVLLKEDGVRILPITGDHEYIPLDTKRAIFGSDAVAGYLADWVGTNGPSTCQSGDRSF